MGPLLQGYGTGYVILLGALAPRDLHHNILCFTGRVVCSGSKMWLRYASQRLSLYIAT